MTDEDDGTVDQSPRTFTVVLIPCAASEELREMGVPQAQGEAFGAMLQFAKRHFAQTGLTEAQREALAAQMRQSTPEAKEEMVMQMVAVTMCDVVPLVPNQAPFGFVAVNLVVDDKAVSKNLPVNARASSLAKLCGLDIQVLGDAFVSRQFDDDHGFRRIDFTLKDLNSDADWIQAVRRFRLAGGSSAPGGGAVGHVDAKNRGNALFAKNDFAGALNEYRISERLCPRTSSEFLGTLKSNISACFMGLNKPSQALVEAEQCVRLRPSWAKAWARQGDALKSLGRVAEARTAFSRALELSPDASDIRARWEACGGSSSSS